MTMTPFPISERNPVAHDAPLPDSADCVVIGGGVIGISTALFLARAGRRVVVVEKGRVAGEQSSRNWGWIRVQGRDFAEIPIAQEAQAIWPTLAAEVDTDISLTQGGVAYLARDARELAEFEVWLKGAAPFGVSSQILDADGVARLLPEAAMRWPGALWTPTDMRAEPFVTVPAIARLAVCAGVAIIEACAARAIEHAAGRVTGVMTERGRIATPEVVVAGGAWSSLLLRHAGVSIPQLSVRGTAMRTRPMHEVFAGGALDHRLAFRRRADGGYTLAAEAHHEFDIGPDAFRAFTRYLPQIISNPFATAFRPAAPRHYPDAWTTPRRWSPDAISPFERMRVLNPAPNMRIVARTARAFSETFRGLGETVIESAWAGMIDTLPDLVPVVDRAAQRPGLTIATGMCGHGFGIGPAFGRITADLVMGRDPGHDLARFRLSRFTDGSRLERGPSL